jgi:hypothetical protein
MGSGKLQFLDLNKRHPGISPGVGQSYSEAARVCLDRHHTSPCDFQLQNNDSNESASAHWPPGDEALKASWANKDDATRDGAYGLALAAIEETRKLFAVGRAETRTGADYYLSEAPVQPDCFEGSYRLEVSGTDEGSAAIINARLKKKLAQAKDGKSNLPAIATVVAFSALRIATADLEES